MNKTTYTASRIILLCIMSAGCALGPDFHRPAPPPVSQYTSEPLPEQTASTTTPGGTAQHFVLGNVPNLWWRELGNDQINGLVETGLRNHPTLEAQQAAIRQAKANLSAQVGQTMFPQLDLALNGSKQQGNAGGSSSGNSVYDLFNTQVNVTYVLDVFGANRRAIEALCALVDYQKFQFEGTALSLSANIVTTALSVAQYQAQVEATKQLIASEKETLDIIIKQYELGAIAKIDVLSEETQYAQLKATLPPLEKAFSQAQNALAQLVGDFPGQRPITHIILDQLQLPEHLPLSIPYALVQNRPDIRAQEALVHQASAQIGVATANLFPQFNISGFAGWQSFTLHPLFSSENFIWNIAGQALQPIFHGGALIAQRDSAVAAYDEAIATYKATVLVAFQNVADALKAIEYDALTHQAQVAAEKVSGENYQLTRKQYELGATNLINLLAAKKSYDEAVLNRINAQAQRYVDTIALYQALGGAPWNI